MYIVIDEAHLIKNVNSFILNFDSAYQRSQSMSYSTFTGPGLQRFRSFGIHLNVNIA